MKIKIQDLIGAPLDWAVATALGHEIEMWHTYQYLGMPHECIVGKGISIGQRDEFGQIGFEPSASGSEVIDIMEQMLSEGCEIHQGGPKAGNQRIWAKLDSQITYYHGPTLRIAVCRCFIASKLGDEVDIPEELL